MALAGGSDSGLVRGQHPGRSHCCCSRCGVGAGAHLACGGCFKYFWQSLGKCQATVLHGHPEGGFQALDGNCGRTGILQGHPALARATRGSHVLSGHVYSQRRPRPTTWPRRAPDWAFFCSGAPRALDTWGGQLPTPCWQGKQLGLRWLTSGLSVESQC